MALDAVAKRQSAAQTLKSAGGYLLTLKLPIYAGNRLASWRTAYAFGIQERTRKITRLGDNVGELEVRLTLSALEASADGTISSTPLNLVKNSRVVLDGREVTITDPGPVSPTGVSILFESTGSIVKATP